MALTRGPTTATSTYSTTRRIGMTLLLLVNFCSRRVQGFSGSSNSLLLSKSHRLSAASSVRPTILWATTRSIHQQKQQGESSPPSESIAADPSQLLTSNSPVIILKRSRQSKAFRNGNQLVFSRSVATGTAAIGDFVLVAVTESNSDKSSKQQDNTKQQDNNSNGQTQPQPQVLPIGWGVYNPNSLYKVRILCHRFLQPSLYQQITSKPEMTVQEALTLVIKHHVEVALQKRRSINLPSPDNTMYRLINGEGDGLSGLQVDVIDSHVVIQSSAAWCETYPELIQKTILEAMEDDTTTIIWKVAPDRLKQDGYPPKLLEELTQKQSDNDEEDEAQAVVATENGVLFQTFPALIGQKTGVYCDQRENRRTVAQYTQGKTVLDLCCYHGGFSLTAVCQGGATMAVGVDSSGAAIQAAKDNAKLNHLSEDKVTFYKSDITEYMKQAAKDETFFDVVVLDPPKLAPTANSLDRASRKYHGLNRDAIKLVNPEQGGLLMTCTCSAAMTEKDGGQFFLNMVSGAAQSAGRQVTLLSKAGAASCHTQSPIAWPAGAYLTAALFYVHPVE